MIGGYAVAFHGHPQATDDIDVLIAPDEENPQRVDARGSTSWAWPRTPRRSPKGIVWIGGPVTHIDITTKVDGLAAFDPLWARRENGELMGERVSYLSLRDLLRTKRAANWPKDQGDIVALEAIQRSARTRVRDESAALARATLTTSLDAPSPSDDPPSSCRSASPVRRAAVKSA